MKFHLLVVFCGLLCAMVNAQQLVKNPDFSELDPKGRPVGWRLSGGRVVKDADGCRLVLKQGQGAIQHLRLTDEMGDVTLQCWMRTTDVTQGKESWQTGRLAMAFRDKNWKQIGGWPNVFGYVGNRDWTLCKRTYRVPRGARILEFSCSHFAQGGLVEFKNVTFTVTRKRMDRPGNAPCPIDAVKAQAVDDAWQLRTSTRTTYSLNGFWQARPVALGHDKLPGKDDCWGWFRIPHNWHVDWTRGGNPQPMVVAWLQDEEEDMLKDVQQAWFKRRFKVPASWSGKSVALDFTLLNTYAKVLVDGQEAGEVFFPGGEVEIGPLLKPGQEQELAMLVKAVPIESASMSFMAPGRAFKVKSTLKGRGVCGDLYLHVRPRQRRIDFVTMIPSVSRGTLTCKVETVGVADGRYGLTAQVVLPDGGKKEFRSSAVELKDGVLSFTSPWRDAPLWETDHPVLLTATVSLLEQDGKTLIDQYVPFTFGFREFSARGKDLLLNGKVIHLRTLYCRTGMSSEAYVNTLEGAKDMISRARRYGFNFLITGHYNFRSGQMCYLDGLLRGCAETGMLLSYSMPHVADFQWKMEDPSVRDKYRQMAKFLVRSVANNPAVVMYAMNHNSTGYFGDQNPLKIDGKYLYDGADMNWNNLTQQGRSRRRVQARAAERIVKSLDSTRLVYHHESGNLGDLHCINTYLNWAPMQERSDWMAHWSKEGVKPVFFVEWGMPHVSSWSSFRGPQFIWRYPALQSLWAAEFAATEYGEDAYVQAAKHGQKIIQVEDKLWDKGEPFHWWRLSSIVKGYPFYYGMMGLYGKDNWRSHRTYGVSAMLPWDQEDMWPRTKVPYEPFDYKVDLNDVKRPGLIPDDKWGSGSYLYDLGDLAKYRASAFGEAFLRWNMPTCAYLGGRKEAFTEKVHVYRSGEQVEKTVICINDTRHDQSVRALVRCRRAGSDEILFSKTLTGKVGVGGVTFLEFALPAPGAVQTMEFVLDATVTFGNGDSWTDAFAFQVLPRIPVKALALQLYDPKGLTKAQLQRLGYVDLTMLDATSSPDLNRLVVIGREALTGAPDLPWLEAVVNRGRLLVFEQSQSVLSKRLGFRTNIHGLRNLYGTRGGHEILRKALVGGSVPTLVANWRGDSTLVPPFLDLPEVESHDPKWMWHGFENTRVWRAGNRGNVADVLIEKPVIGDWLPLLVGGFDLQYSPLLLGRNGQGVSLFCQLDVTGRTATEPAAENLLVSMIDYMASVPLIQRERQVFYAGGQEGRQVLNSLGIVFRDYAGEDLTDALLVLGRGCANALGTVKGRPGKIFGLGLTKADLACSPLSGLGVTAETGKGFAQILPQGEEGVLRGLTHSDTYWHTELTYDRLRGAGIENESLAVLANGDVVLQQVPSWSFGKPCRVNLRISERRADGLTSRLLSNLGAERRPSVLGKNLSENISMAEVNLLKGWVGVEDPKNVGRGAGWYKADFVPGATWKPIKVGGCFEGQRKHLAGYDGLFWYRLEFDLPQDFGKELAPVLNVGAVDDESWIWLNGKFLGEVSKKTHPSNYWQAPRQYQLKRSDLREGGKNVLVVLVNDTYMNGGVMGWPHFEVRGRWNTSYYVQKLAKDDDPYRYYRW